MALPSLRVGRQRANFGGGLGEREATAEPPPAREPASRGITQTLRASIYGPQGRRQNPRQQMGAGSACRTNFGGGLGERSAGPTATCCRASYRQAMRNSRASPSQRACRVVSKAEFGNSNLWFPNSSIEPAPASGSRSSRPAASSCRLADRNSRGVTTLSFLTTKNLEASIYGRQIRLAGASTASKLSLG